MKPGILKRDVWAIGIMIGITLPFLLFMLLYAVDTTIHNLLKINLTEHFHYLFLLSLTANLFPIRHYFVKLRYEKTGMGILLITILAILTYFFIYYES